VLARDLMYYYLQVVDLLNARLSSETKEMVHLQKLK